MIEIQEIDALMESTAVVVREYFAAERNKIMREMEVLELRVLDCLAARLKEIPAGLQGEKGSDGKDGRDGREGIDGKDGVGLTGPAGKDGRDGIDGKDGVPGIAGKDGKDGQNGIDGKDGHPGIAGNDGGLGRDGENGADGKDGRDGRDGIAGKDGRDGLAGRDAIEIDIQEYVEGKVYARGSYLRHRGGISRITGDNIAQVMIEGIDSIEFRQADDLRTFSIKVVLTSGAHHETKFSSPVLIYREIFKEGTEYLRGDIVTRDGSVWHCNVDHTKIAPGTPSTSDWTLCVKRGQNGKDGVNGKPGDRGPEGPAGKDFRTMGGKW